MTFRRHAVRLTPLGSMAILLLSGCGKDGVEAGLTEPVAAAPVAKAPGRLPPDIPVTLTIDDPGNRITSDAGGSYSHGVESVSAKIDGHGSLIVDTGAERTINFDFAGSAVSPSNTFIPNQSGKQSVSIRTAGPDLRTQAIGTTACSPLAFVFSGTVETNSVLFHGYAAASDANTTYAYATRTASGWSFTSFRPAGASQCGTAPDHHALVRSQDLTVRKAPMLPKGYYVMPFSKHQCFRRVTT
jgi:hypothetical protein